MMETIFLTGKNILIISPEAFDHIPVSKHHYSKVLAGSGNQVFFLNPPGTRNGVVKDAHNDGLFIVDYKTIPGINRFPGAFRDLVNAYLIRKIERMCRSQFDVVWTFDPFRFQNLRLFSRSLVRLYHVVDVHQAPLEMQVASTADVILATADEILKPFLNLRKTTAKINHGLAPHFLNTKPATTTGKPIKVGYVGNLDRHSIDHKTLLQIVRTHTQVEFYFIGPYHETSYIYLQLRENKNCFFIGKVQSEQLPEYFRQYDVFLMCYKGDEVAINANPHKLLEFLAVGKPAVINYTDEYKDSGLVIMADSNSDLPNLFHQVIADLDHYASAELQRRRIAFARENSYAQHVRTIDKILTNFLHAASASDTQ
jgi:glycosyltransferase involved in cell wall biosynthesis